MAGRNQGRKRRSETDTESLRRERGEPGGPGDPRDAMSEVPLAPHSAGIIGVGAAPSSADSTLPESAESDLREARARGEK